jgi:regulator of RNase E activity RraA
VAGPVLPVRHAGSVDVFFEALQAAPRGALLCIDNGGRLDEGCIGDLTALEAMHHGCAGIVVDGAHRDTQALRGLGLPVWSRGACPAGPLAARPRHPDALRSAAIASHLVSADDVAAADDDGVVFVAKAQAARVWELARRIQATEADQARRAAAGDPLCEQFQVKAFLAARAKDPALGFRAHLRSIGKSIEE